MVRKKMIRLSEDEHERLETYREEEYGTDSIAYGVVIRDLIEEVQGELNQGVSLDEQYEGVVAMAEEYDNLAAHIRHCAHGEVDLEGITAEDVSIPITSGDRRMFPHELNHDVQYALRAADGPVTLGELNSAVKRVRERRNDPWNWMDGESSVWDEVQEE